MPLDLDGLPWGRKIAGDDQSAFEREAIRMGEIVPETLYSWERLPLNGTVGVVEFFRHTIGTAKHGRADTNLWASNMMLGNQCFLTRSLRFRLRGATLALLPISWLWEAMARAMVEFAVSQKVFGAWALPAQWSEARLLDPPVALLPLRPFGVTLRFPGKIWYALPKWQKGIGIVGYTDVAPLEVGIELEGYLLRGLS